MLSKYARDQLVEVVNIGAGNASTALGKLLKKRVDITVPDSFVGLVQDASDFFGQMEEVMTVVMVKVMGETPGVIFLAFPPQDALKISKALAGDKSEEEITDKYNISTIGEVGNIIAGASLTALSKFLDVELFQTVPATAVDMVGAVSDTILAEVGKDSETILIFRVDMDIPDSEIKGNMFFIFDPQATDRIVAAAEKYSKKSE